MWRVMIGVVLVGGAAACSKTSSEPTPTSSRASGSAQPKPADRRAMPGATPDQIITRLFASETVSKVEARYVRADGRLDPKFGQLSARSIFPTDTRGPEAARPLGAPIEWNRSPMFLRFVTWDSTGAVLNGDSGYGDAQAVLVRPACTVAQLWQKAIAGGAPRDALAVIVLEAASEGRPQRWVFTITDGPRRTAFRLEVPDDCPATAEASPP